MTQLEFVERHGLEAWHARVKPLKEIPVSLANMETFEAELACNANRIIDADIRYVLQQLGLDAQDSLLAAKAEIAHLRKVKSS